jgi:hypothetical protein
MKLFKASIFLIILLFSVQAYALDIEANRFCTDHASTATGCTKALLDAIGTTKKATLVYNHSSNETGTSYAVGSPLAFPANVDIKMASGAYFTFTGTGVITGLKEVTPQMFGIVGDGSTQTVAMNALHALAATGVPIHFSAGDYRTATPWLFTTVPNLIGEPGARISLSASGGVAYVIKIDYSGVYLKGGLIDNLILDGRGFVADGLYLKAVISADFNKVRATNVTGAGLHMAWAQQCKFVNFTVSRNVEPFTTTPVNGILIDGAISSSANIFINPSIEHISGSGIKALSLINSQIIGGTSEGNNVGLEFGEAVATLGLQVTTNTIIGMDLEVNTVADIILRATAGYNIFTGMASGYLSPPIQILGAHDNMFYGGESSGFILDAASTLNMMDGVKINPGGTIADAGSGNTWSGVMNPTNPGVAFVGKAPSTVYMWDNQSFTMSMGAQGALLFSVYNASTGVAAIFAASRDSSTITKLHDPGNHFEITDVDTGKMAIFKGAGSAVITIKNYTNATIGVGVSVYGNITAVTAPAS